jgi:hypothetical protein
MTADAMQYPPRLLLAVSGMLDSMELRQPELAFYGSRFKTVKRMAAGSCERRATGRISVPK